MSDAIALEYGSFTGAAEVAERRTASLLLIGVNHHTAPVAIRERLSVGETKQTEVTESLMRLRGVEGTCVLSTCNRVEIIVSGAAEADDVIDWMARYARCSRDLIEPHLYIRRGGEAVSHLFRVAAGLDSMVIGEPQIAGQVKKAFGAAALDRTLQHFFERTMHVAKKVRSETAIGANAVSVPYAAIELAKKIFGDLSGLHVLLLGAGDVGELTAEHLAAQHVRQIFVANKTWERAVELSQRFGGKAVPFAAFEEQLTQCDIVIASTGAPHFVIDAAHVQRALHARGRRGLFLIDLAVPRNIDPAIAGIDGAYLYNVDDLQQVAKGNLERRRCEAARAERIIAAEVRSFNERLAIDDAVPTIVELRSRVDEIRSAELQKCLRRMGPITLEQRAAVEQFATQLTNKILHQPIVELRRSDSLRGVIRRIFGLQP
ncbi:MAG TPA: glutamyl-tRNA reductase [Thermoanaerobaculia bacterium]|nr:glutamyl-tRNA reductase [Thermoanaerobaculia bacterium]